MKEWRMWQQVYNSLVTEHTDARHLHQRVEKPYNVEDALNYVKEQGTVGVYPAKSYIVAVIYATMVNKVYGEDLYEALNDPELLHGQDDFFVPYSQEKERYDELIERLKSMGNWLEGGWAPKTVEYFHLECTEEGVNSING